ncbi:MAG: Mrp/NBP35 family ATP-binding protein [Elusimicrobiales bacterium]|nr:Mrp/NBP35 family ATP-binding protein [Elusimicrobiales bacterium]
MHDIRIDHRTSIIKDKMSKIKNKIIVMSNKGGVGKSTISVLLSSFLVKKGFKTAILDADIHGPSIAKMTSTESDIYSINNDGTINPVEKGNLKIVSFGGIIKENDKAIIWRAPIKISIIRQLLSDIKWGELDYLIIDLPPGTGDESLSICQQVNDITGAIVITTPQKISKLDVKKALDFLSKLNIKIISVVENMNNIKCPHCQNEFELFSNTEEIIGYKTIKIPFIYEIAKNLDEGQFENILENHPDLSQKISDMLF